MSEYRVVWQRIPYCNFDRQVLFVEARDEDHARAVTKDYVERRFGYGNIGFRGITLYEKPEGGKVL
jgi:hypothetical protein